MFELLKRFLDSLPSRQRAVVTILVLLCWAFLWYQSYSFQVQLVEQQKENLRHQDEREQQFAVQLAELKKELLEQQRKLVEQQKDNLQHQDEREQEFAIEQQELPKRLAQQQQEDLDRAFANIGKTLAKTFTGTPEEKERANAVGHYEAELRRAQSTRLRRNIGPLSRLAQTFRTPTIGGSSIALRFASTAYGSG
jgi:DNA repair exonuclease SbcCD ATPase subunit